MGKLQTSKSIVTDLQLLPVIYAYVDLSTPVRSFILTFLNLLPVLKLSEGFLEAGTVGCTALMASATERAYDREVRDEADVSLSSSPSS